MYNKIIDITKNKNRISINMKAMYIGEDLLVILSGGDRAHIGAVSFGGVNDENKTKPFKLHKDYILSDMFSEKIKKEFKNNYVICAGVHLDNITKDEIIQVKELSEELLEILIKYIREV